MKIRNRELRHWIFPRFQAITTLYFQCSKLQSTNIALSIFYEENNFSQWLTKRLWCMFELWCDWGIYCTVSVCLSVCLSVSLSLAKRFVFYQKKKTKKNNEEYPHSISSIRRWPWNKAFDVPDDWSINNFPLAASLTVHKPLRQRPPRASIIIFCKISL